VCLRIAPNELAYFFSHGWVEFRYGTPIGPVALDWAINSPCAVCGAEWNVSATVAAACQTRFRGCLLPILHQSGDDVLMRRSLHLRLILLFAAASRQSRPDGAGANGRVVDRIAARIEGENIILLSQVRELRQVPAIGRRTPESDDRLLAELIDQWIVQTESQRVASSARTVEVRPRTHAARRAIRKSRGVCAKLRELGFHGAGPEMLARQIYVDVISITSFARRADRIRRYRAYYQKTAVRLAEPEKSAYAALADVRGTDPRLHHRSAHHGLATKMTG